VNSYEEEARAFEEELQAFKDGAGTYLEVLLFSEPTNPDGFLVLYLRPSRKFLLLGYWFGYERSFAIGEWSRGNATIHLEGHGRLEADFVPDGNRSTFRRVFAVETHVLTPTLVATEFVKGSSLLGNPGRLQYCGQRTIIDPDGQWLPKSLHAVDEWIGRSEEWMRK